jgi:hypothetical protein
MTEAELDALERALLDSRRSPHEAAPVFLLGSPRTGSTPLYQAMVAGLGLGYFANIANAWFPKHPAIGVQLQLAGPPEPIVFESRYGKVEGLLQPSEASGIVSAWCGGGHPSETTSPGVLPERIAHMRETLAWCEAAFGAPLLIKNAWNCFRVAELARVFPRASFVWIRRDIVAAASSDLRARGATKDNEGEWNSATPRNLEALKRLPPAAQVVENQYEFARAIAEAFAGLAPGRACEVWYEDFCLDPDGTVEKLGEASPTPRRAMRLALAPSQPAGDLLPAVDDYVRAHASRLAPLTRAGRTS